MVLAAVLKAPGAIILKVSKIAAIIKFEFETCSTLEQLNSKNQFFKKTVIEIEKFTIENFEIWRFLSLSCFCAHQIFI